MATENTVPDTGTGVQANREVDYEIYENRAAQLPMCYTLSALKV